MSLNVDPKNLSISKLRDQVLQNLKSNDDSDWVSNQKSDPSSQLLDVVSFVGSVSNVQALMSRREGFFNYAQNRSSAIGHAQHKHYSVFRGKNTHLNLIIIPSATQTLIRWQVIGSYSNLDVVYVGQDQVLFEGVESVIEVVVGNLINDSIVQTNSDFTDILRFKNVGISQDIRVMYKQTEQDAEIEVELGTTMLDLIYDKVVTITNSYDGIDLYYDNNKPNPLNLSDRVLLTSSVSLPVNLEPNKNYYVIPVVENLVKFALTEIDSFNNIPIQSDYLTGLGTYFINNTYSFTPVKLSEVDSTTDTFAVDGIYPRYKYLNGSSFRLEYIQLNEIKVTDISQILLDVGTIQYLDSRTRVLNNYVPIESIGSIKVKAPLNYETQFIVKSREDYPKILKMLDPLIIETKGNDISPSIMELTYLRSDKTLLTNDEKLLIYSKLCKMRSMGGQPPIIVDSEEVNLLLTVYIKLYPNVVLPNLTSEIRNVLTYELDSNPKKFRENSLEYTIDLEQLEHELEHLINSDNKKFAKVVRVGIFLDTYNLDRKYLRGNFISPSIQEFIFTTDYLLSNSNLLVPDHSFFDSQEIYLTTTNTLPSGLIRYTKYFIKVIDSNNIELYSDVNLTTIITFTTNGLGIHSLYNNDVSQIFECYKTIGLGSQDFTVSHCLNQGKYIDFSTNHNLVNGQIVRFQITDPDSVLPIPLSENNVYKVLDSSNPLKITVSDYNNSDNIYFSTSGINYNYKLISGVVLNNTIGITGTTKLPISDVTNLNVGDKVKLYTNGLLPNPLKDSIYYYIVSVDTLTNEIELSELEDLTSIISFLSDGDGVHTLHTNYGYGYTSNTPVSFLNRSDNSVFVDNNVVWKTHPNDLNDVKIKWNEYFLIDFNLETN